MTNLWNKNCYEKFKLGEIKVIIKTYSTKQLQVETFLDGEIKRTIQKLNYPEQSKTVQKITLCTKYVTCKK